MRYAEKTSVPIQKSQGEVRDIISKYGAKSFAFGEQDDQHVVMFEAAGRRIKIVLPMPVKHKTKDKHGYLMSQDQVDKERRRRWRCLVLAIKAKLECVESGITTLEQEFLAHIVLPTGQTVGQATIPLIAEGYATGRMPPLLGFGG